ncbi:MAG: hypothetical protein AAGH81_19360 [Bacteroidota bacterium]
MKISRILFLVFVTTFSNLYSQQYYVDPSGGNDLNNGTLEKPLKNIKTAVTRGNGVTGSGTIEIVLLPGLYLLQDKMVINPIRILNDTTEFIIKAYHNPNDTDWLPSKMPIVQSVSNNNSKTQFSHATGFLVASKNVRFEGIKFLGNSNPGVKYYYPISREDPSLENLTVEQCMFIGAKESSPIQGAIWAHGKKTKIENNVFYQCRNAILLFKNVEGFKISNNIISESYESAFWIGPVNPKFEFTNNVVFNNNAFIVGNKNLNYNSIFNKNMIQSNKIPFGYWSRALKEIVRISKPKVTLKNQVTATKISQATNNEVALDKNHLHIDSNEMELISKVGIFSNE